MPKIAVDHNLINPNFPGGVNFGGIHGHGIQLLGSSTFFGIMSVSVDAWLEVIKDWILHWAICEFCKSWLNTRLTRPAASVVYLWWDYQDGI